MEQEYLILDYSVGGSPIKIRPVFYWIWGLWSNIVSLLIKSSDFALKVDFTGEGLSLNTDYELKNLVKLENWFFFYINLN